MAAWSGPAYAKLAKLKRGADLAVVGDAVFFAVGDLQEASRS